MNYDIEYWKNCLCYNNRIVIRINEFVIFFIIAVDNRLYIRIHSLRPMFIIVFMAISSNDGHYPAMLLHFVKKFDNFYITKSHKAHSDTNIHNIESSLLLWDNLKLQTNFKSAKLGKSYSKKKENLRNC